MLMLMPISVYTTYAYAYAYVTCKPGFSKLKIKKKFKVDGFQEVSVKRPWFDTV